MSDLGINVAEEVGTQERIGPDRPPVRPQDLLQFNAVGLLLVHPKGSVRVVAVKALTASPDMALSIAKGSTFHIQEDVEVK